MSDLLEFLALALLYFPLTVLLNRLQLVFFPKRKSLPAQGTIARSAILALVLLLLASGLLLGVTLQEKLLWTAYSATVLGCFLLLYISVMCVSESGRRFYFMVLVEKSDGSTRSALQAAYGREHMLAVRLQRLVTWGVLQENGRNYILRRRSAYWYSRFFQLWGRLLGFDWLEQGRL